MTPDYPALAQRLRDIGLCRLCAADNDRLWAEFQESRNNLSSAKLGRRMEADERAAAIDLESAASALDRLAGMETALRGLDSAMRTFLAGMVKVKKREADKAFYAEDFERCCNALATARRALEGK